MVTLPPSLSCPQHKGWWQRNRGVCENTTCLWRVGGRRRRVINNSQESRGIHSDRRQQALVSEKGRLQPTLHRAQSRMGRGDDVGVHVGKFLTLCSMFPNCGKSGPASLGSFTLSFYRATQICGRQKVNQTESLRGKTVEWIKRSEPLRATLTRYLEEDTKI